MDKYQELANEIIDELSDYFEEKYGITYKDIKEKETWITAFRKKTGH